MPRVKLNELPEYEFSHSLSVRATDINYAGHVGNEAILGITHEARTQFMSHLGFDTVAVKEMSIGLIIADLVVNFKAEAYIRDHLEIDCQIDEIQEKSFRLFHRVRRGEQVIALVETGLVAFDYRTSETVQLPKEYLTSLEKYRIALSGY